MRPETFRKRLEVLRQRAVDARPIAPTPVLFAAEGESTADARQRAGVPPGAFCVVITTVDMSTPRPEAAS